MKSPSGFTVNHRLKTLLVFCIVFVFSFSVNAQVVLNEVMVRPGDPQGLVVFNGNSGNEYIELYNPSCSPVDVSGFFVACRQDFAGTPSGGAFRIPNVPAAVIQPGRYLVLGTSTSSADPNSIDIKLPDYTSNYCLNAANRNFILANADGWVALYNAQGVPVDAIFWASAASRISRVDDFGGNPCVPAGSPMGVSLESAQQINSNFPGVMSYVGDNPSAGLTYSRIPDGGSWQSSINPSVNDLTVGNCNGGNCVTVSSISLTAAVTNPSCAQSNGSIAINVTSAGVATFAWSANANTGNNNTANNLTAGTYGVTVTQSGCTKDTSITLVAPNSPILTISNVQNPTCSGNNGSLSATISGGTAPYSVSIDTGAGAPINITVPIATAAPVNNLPARTITINITDAAGCSVTQSVTLAAPTNCCQFSFSASVTQPACGATNGAIAITVANGSGNYSYTWSSNANAGNVSQAANLGAGNYLVTITDLGFSNCTKDTAISLASAGAPVISSINKTDESCLGANDGSAIVVASGGTGTLTYLWTSGQPQPNINNLSPGNYTVSVTDANGCVAVGNTTIIQGPVCCALTAIINVQQTNCNAATGSITITVDVNSGDAPFQYSINGGNTFSANNNFTALAAATYLVEVRDINNCFFRDTVTVTEANNDINLSVTPIDVSCFGQNDASIVLNISGSNTPFSIEWSDGVTQVDSRNNLASGIYDVTITDQLGCTETASITLIEPLPFIIDLGENQTICIGNNIVLDAGNASSYEWSDGTIQSSVTISEAGVYSVTAVNGNSCIAIDSVEIFLSEATVNAGNDTSIIENNAVVLGAISNSNGGSFIWSPSTSLSCNNCNNPVATPRETTTYTVTFTNEFSCAASDDITITVIEGEYYFYMPNVFSPNADGSNDLVFPIYNGTKQFTLRIWNRWGQKVFECVNVNEGCVWDGTVDGKLLDPTVLVWEAVVEFKIPSIERYKGSITLIK